MPEDGDAAITIRASQEQEAGPAGCVMCCTMWCEVKTETMSGEREPVRTKHSHRQMVLRLAGHDSVPFRSHVDAESRSEM